MFGISFVQGLSMAMFGVAGGILYLMLFNRWMIMLPQNRVKAPVILGLFVAIPGGAALAGLALARTPWMYAPLVFLALLTAGEIRCALIRRACVAEGPVESVALDGAPAGWVTTSALVMRRYELMFQRWGGPPFRIAHLSDLHVHTSLPAGYYKRALEAAANARPDLVFITGDFITHLDSLPKLDRVLRPVGRLHTFAVLGNHDYWTDAARVGEAVRACGVRLLADESDLIEIGGHAVRVSGLDYPWGAGMAGVARAGERELHLVLSHTPDNIYRLAKAGAHAVFSGHLHAGQIRIPHLGSIVIPSVYGRRFDHGHFLVRGTHLFVAGGIGSAVPPVRIFCPPDLFIVDVRGIS